MQQISVKADLITYSASISSCSRGQWELALTLLDRMVSCVLQPDVIVYNAAASACEKHWVHALHLLREARQRGLLPGVITYSASISACEKGQQWKMAVGLLEEMQLMALWPDV